LPERSTRSRVSYARPARKKNKKGTSRRKSSKILASDTIGPSAVSKAKTERSKIRLAVAGETKPKREAFVLAKKDYFQPLLPSSSYVQKLERLHALAGDEDDVPKIVMYRKFDHQPLGVKAIMKSYQLEGLSFLVYMQKNGMSSILGDEMGLGKTLQTLALFQYLAEYEPDQQENRPHLVVCPMSVLSSWMAEARKWVPNLHAVRFHGPKAEREKLKHDLLMTAKEYSNNDDNEDRHPVDIVVTTYDTFKAEQGWLKRAFAWRYIVLDEGHKIKNEESGMAHSLQSIQAEHRLLLTGTPLQNNLKEMWALLHWLYPDVFTMDTADMFKDAFNLSLGKASTTFMDDARRLLELVMLRRMKSSPGVNLGLPPKEEVLLYVPLTPMQRFWYTRLLTKADNALLDELFRDVKGKVLESCKHESDDEKQLALLEKGAAAADGVDRGDAIAGGAWAESKHIMEKALQNEQQADVQSGNWRKLMNIIMQLRKVCSHPYVLSPACPDPYYLGEHIKTASGKFIVLDKLIEELVMRRGKKVLIFAGFTKTLDLCEDLLTLKGANAHHASFRYLRLDGSTARARRNLGIRMFNDPTSEFKVMLIATRAGGLGINLASASDVIFMDEDWNPQITLQAEARAHRIGQTQPVTIYKICTKGTAEEQMQGRIRKKLYLSAKITESMRNIHGHDDINTKKRKRTSTATVEDDTPSLGTDQLKSLLRKGAQTLARPQVDVTEMLSWDFATMIDKCKDRADDPSIAGDGTRDVTEEDEQKWLSTMEKVETAVFEGKRHHKQLEKVAEESVELSRADRRVGKNTTVMVGGFAINKESLQCADWEAVPTLAGKDPRLAEPIREKRPPINHQDHCQRCRDGGEMVLCSGCPRSYHIDCLDQTFQAKAQSKFLGLYCPQHQCVECEAKTSDAGGMIFRCRWCENGYCEDCLDWDVAKLVGATLPELELLGFAALSQAWFIECPACLKHWETDQGACRAISRERAGIEERYGAYAKASA